MIRTALAISVFVFQSVTADADEVTIEVAAGKHDRVDTAVSVELPAVLSGHRHLSLRRLDTGTQVPVQITGGERRRAVWLLSTPLRAGRTRRYRLSATKQPPATKDRVTVKDDGKQLRVAVAGKPVLVYNTAVVPSPDRKEAYYDRSGYIHPLYNPRGQVITDDFAPDHPHQHGIMFPWTKTTFEGRALNFWDQKGGKGRVEHATVGSREGGEVFGEFTVHLKHLDDTVGDTPKAVLAETWRVRVYNLADQFLFDLESVQRASGNPLRIQKYHYGGLAIRGHRNWLTPGQGDFLTSEGKTRKNGNHTRPDWCDIHGNVDGKVTGVTIFCAPSNLRSPHPVRLHPQKPYFCFAPMVLGGFEISAERPYVSRYRFYVHNGRLDSAAAERIWKDLAEPPIVKVVGGSQQSVARGDFAWKASPALLGINAENLPPSPDNPWHAVKDPSIVRYQGRWHLFCTLRKQRGGDGRPPGYIRVGYLSFADWKDASAAKWNLLTLSMGYHGAPQIFYFTPKKKWYLVYQLEDRARNISYGPCYSTTDDIADPTSWTLPTPFYTRKPDHVPGWLDFWVICDETKAHLFFTSLNGRMWRAETKLFSFPRGFGDPRVVLRGDVFEASHTYRLQGVNKYLTVIEAQGRSGGRGRRYYKAYIADRLDGEWQELAATADKPFAGSINVQMAEPRWTDSISHGELLRSGSDERMEVDPTDMRFLFQGLTDNQWGKGYGRLGWRLGLLESATVQRE